MQSNVQEQFEVDSQIELPGFLLVYNIWLWSSSMYEHWDVSMIQGTVEPLLTLYGPKKQLNEANVRISAMEAATDTKQSAIGSSRAVL